MAENRTYENQKRNNGVLETPMSVCSVLITELRQLTAEVFLGS